MAKNNYVVIVSNIGTVYNGRNKRDANKSFVESKRMIAANYGQWACECVTMLFNGLIEREYFSKDFNYDI